MSKQLLISTALLAAMCLGSCESGTLTDTFAPVENHAWEYNDVKTVEVVVDDTTQLYDILVNLRHAGDYEWQNIYVRMHILSPQGDSTAERLSLMLADSKGKWLGSGLGDIITIQAPYKQGIQFRQLGTYRFTLEQHMRVNPLKGVYEVGLKVQTTKSE